MSPTSGRFPHGWAVLLVVVGGTAAAIGASGVTVTDLRHPPLGHLAALVIGGVTALFGLSNLYRRK